MASDDPSTAHRVISPFWIFRKLDGESLKLTVPRVSSPAVDMVENLVTIGARESGSIRGMTEMGLIGIGEE